MGDRDSGQRVLKNQHNHDDDDQLNCAENSTSSVVVALIKFYEKSRNRVVDNKRDAANNSETANSANTYARDKVSKLDHIPRALPMELKPNYSKIVSEGTNAGNFGLAPGHRIVNGSGQGVKILQDNVQDGQSLKKKRKNSNSKLKNTFSIKN